MRKSFWFSFLFIVSSYSLASADPTCHSLATSEAQGEVCFYKQDRTKNPDILYFFHGIDSGARNWSDRPDFQTIQSLWEKSEHGAPTIISVSFGKRWLMMTAHEKSRGIHDDFVHKVMPQLEDEIGGLSQGRGFILGESMGGANAAMLFLREQNLFTKAAFLCPGFSRTSPFASLGEMWDYIQRTGASALTVWYFMGVARDLIGRAEDWPPNSAIDIATHALSPSTPPIYVSCGNQDEYGFFEGASTMAQMAKDHGARAVWVPRDGRHCTNHDPQSILNFFNQD